MRLFVLLVAVLLAFVLAGCKPGELLSGAPTTSSAVQDPLKVELEQLGFSLQGSPYVVAGVATEDWSAGDGWPTVSISSSDGKRWKVSLIEQAGIVCEINSASADDALRQFDAAKAIIDAGTAIPQPNDRLLAAGLSCSI